MAKNSIEGFAESILSVANEISSGKEMKDFMGKAGNELKKTIKATARRKVTQRTGNYHKSIKRGRVWNRNGSVSVNVYSDDNKAHLIEKGHRIVVGGKLGEGGQEVGFIKGKYIFQEGSDDYFEEFEEEAEEFLDKLLDEL